MPDYGHNLRFVLLFLFVCVLAVPIFADDSSGTINPKLGTFHMEKNDAISMIDETVAIYHDRVLTVFHFKNLTGKKVEVTLGFPVVDFPGHKSGVGREEPGPVINETNYREHFDQIDAYYQFTTYVNKKKIERTITFADAESGQHPGAKTFFFTVPISFKPHETITVENSYNQSTDRFFDSMSNYGSRIVYVLTSGATWATPIKRAELRYYDIHSNKNREPFDFGIGAKYFRTMGYSIEPHEIKTIEGGSICIWKFTNWLPTRNLEIEEQYNWKMPRGYWYVTYIMKTTDLLDQSEIYGYASYSDTYSVLSDTNSILAEIAKIDRQRFTEDIDEMYHFIFFDEKDKPLPYTDSLKPGLARKYARVLKNAIFALHGYRFKDQTLRTMFEYFDWYRAIPEYRNDFTEQEKRMIDNLKKCE